MRAFLPCFILGLAAVLLPGCKADDAGSTIEVVLSGEGRRARIEGFSAGLAELGWDEASVTICNAQEEAAALSRCAEAAKGRHAEMIVATGGAELKALHDTFPPIDAPVLYIGLGHSLGWGYIDSFSSPGGWLTGIDNAYAEISGKRLEWLSLFLPHVERVALLYQRGVIPNQLAIAAVEEAGASLGVEVYFYEIVIAEDIGRLDAFIKTHRIEAAMISPSVILENSLDTLVLPLLDEEAIPLVGLHEEMTRKGALLSFGASQYAMGRQAARLAVKILQGAEVAQLPVEYPDMQHLAVNVAVAKRLGIDISPALLGLADEVIGR